MKSISLRVRIISIKKPWVLKYHQDFLTKSMSLDYRGLIHISLSINKKNFFICSCKEMLHLIAS